MSLLRYIKDQRAHRLAKAFRPVFVRYDAETASETLYQNWGEDSTLPDRYRLSRTVSRKEAALYALVCQNNGNLADEPYWTKQYNRPQWGYFASIETCHSSSGPRYIWSDEFPTLGSPIKQPIAFDPDRNAVFYFPERLWPCRFLQTPARVMAVAAHFDEGWNVVEIPVTPTTADTWGCDETKYGKPILNNWSRVHVRGKPPIVDIDTQVQLKLNERLVDVRVTGREDDRYSGHIEALPPRSKTRLKGLEPGQSLTFRYEHIFGIGSSQIERSREQ